MLPEIS
jgi:hypothetical protein